MAIKMSAGRSRGLLVGFNLLSWVAGTGLLGFGILMMSDNGISHLYRVITAYAESNEVALEKATYVASDGIKYLSYLVTSIGAFILVFGFLGCCGTITDSKCLMVSYFVSLFVILCAELGMVVIAIVYRELILDGMEDRLHSSMKYFYAQDTTYTNSLDYTQYSLECCGVHGGMDFVHSKWKNGTSSKKTVPLTCCILANGDASTNDAPWLNPFPLNEEACQTVDNLPKNNFDDARHVKGCFEKLQTWFKRSTTLIVSIGMGLATLSVLGMVASICLCRHMEDP